MILFVLVNTGPKRLNPHQVRIFLFFFIIACYFVLVVRAFVSRLNLYSTDWVSFRHLAQLFRQLRRLRGTLVSQKPSNLTPWYSLVKSAPENGHKFTTSRFASPENVHLYYSKGFANTVRVSREKRPAVFFSVAVIIFVYRFHNQFRRLVRKWRAALGNSDHSCVSMRCVNHFKCVSFRKTENLVCS